MAVDATLATHMMSYSLFIRQFIGNTLPVVEVQLQTQMRVMEVTSARVWPTRSIKLRVCACRWPAAAHATTGAPGRCLRIPSASTAIHAATRSWTALATDLPAKASHIGVREVPRQHLFAQACLVLNYEAVAGIAPVNDVLEVGLVHHVPHGRHEGGHVRTSHGRLRLALHITV